MGCVVVSCLYAILHPSFRGGVARGTGELRLISYFAIDAGPPLSFLRFVPVRFTVITLWASPTFCILTRISDTFFALQMPDGDLLFCSLIAAASRAHCW